MPGAPTQAVMDMVTPHFVGLNLPGAAAAAFWQAIDAAGLTVVDKAAGLPVTVADTAPCERVQMAGMPGHWLVGVKVGERGWYSWVEIHASSGAVTRLPPVFTAGAGDFLLRPKTTGRFTVGTSAIHTSATDPIS